MLIEIDCRESDVDTFAFLFVIEFDPADVIRRGRAVVEVESGFGPFFAGFEELPGEVAVRVR